MNKKAELDLSFFSGKRILVTGHTGFKGAWLSVMLRNAGAEVIGYSTCSAKETRLSDLCGVLEQIHHIQGDICDLNHLQAVFSEYRPELVIHMAAQPLVRESYRDPVRTYSTNVMGTVNLMECVRNTPEVRSVLNVTTDKVYRNRERSEGYTEEEELWGFDPYSNSKSCSELVTGCYKDSFFAEREIAVSTARAGNVIGGGDFAKDRIIPDCVRAATAGQEIIVRNPNSVRPYQHVLEPLYAYLMILEKQYQDRTYAGNYNVGPNETEHWTTSQLVDCFVKDWGDNVVWNAQSEQNAPHEAGLLKLDCARLKTTFGWEPCWNIAEAIHRVVEFEKNRTGGGNVRECMDRQIKEYMKDRRDMSA
ncbi:MAG: CDP-glucose 4,6-dehydratase [Lachnospiraceae bacterium]|nr:CDP-glucose 4,6-dehydratase [Lachnospiraceae bacterium]